MNARKFNRTLKHSTALLLVVHAFVTVPATGHNQPAAPIQNAAASNHPPAHPPAGHDAASIHSNTNHQSPQDINPALRNATESLATENILDPSRGKIAKDPTKDHQAMLDQAIDYKHDKHYAMAEDLFVRVLKSEAPVEMHRTACLELALMAQENKQSARAQRQKVEPRALC